MDYKVNDKNKYTMINFNIEVASEKHIPYVAEILQTIEESLLHKVYASLKLPQC